MKIAIYQVNGERDRNRVAFMRYDSLERRQGSPEVDSTIYDKVFDGAVDCADLEVVYQKFNTEIPDGYTGHSLSVSDIVEVQNGSKSTFYFCDSFGFKEVDFKPEQAVKTEPQTLKVVLCRPGKLAQITDIGASLASMQKAVGGTIEAFYPFDEEVCIVCNDEGKINGSLPNRAVYGDDGQILDIVCGTFFICDCSGEDFGSLSSKQLEHYWQQFKYPEQFLQVNGEIKAVPYKPEKDLTR